MKQFVHKSSGLFSSRVLSITLIAWLFFTTMSESMAQQAEKINNLNSGMPNRISMNVTVARQTQGQSFGEKVNAGLQASGKALAQGASLVGAVLPGGSIISAALSKVNSDEVEWQVRNQGNGFLLPENLDPGDYYLTIVVATGNGTTDRLRTGIRLGVLSGDNGVTTAVVSSVSGLSGSGGGASSASYARAPGAAIQNTGTSNPKAISENSAEKVSADNSYYIFINGVEYALVKARTGRNAAKSGNDATKSIINNPK